MQKTHPAIEQLQASLSAAPSTQRLSDSDLESIYALAYSVYRHGQYAKAGSYFSYLTLYRPTNARFLKALGACQFMQRAFEQAAATYAFLVMLDAHDVESLCMWGHAMLMTGDKVTARKAMTRAAELSTTQTEYGQRANALLDLLGR